MLLYWLGHRRSGKINSAEVLQKKRSPRNWNHWRTNSYARGCNTLSKCIERFVVVIFHVPILSPYVKQTISARIQLKVNISLLLEPISKILIQPIEFWLLPKEFDFPNIFLKNFWLPDIKKKTQRDVRYRLYVLVM